MTLRIICLASRLPAMTQHIDCRTRLDCRPMSRMHCPALAIGHLCYPAVALSV